MADTQAGVGAQGLKQGGQMEADIAAMSNQAKRIAETRQAAVEANAAKNLEMLRKGNEMRAQSLNDQAADFVMKALKPNAKTNPQGYMRDLELRIADMETKAKEVKKSKSGNVEAEQTYMKVSEILRKRLLAMQNEQMQATTAEESAVAPKEGTYNLRPGRTESVPGE